MAYHASYQINRHPIIIKRVYKYLKIALSNVIRKRNFMVS